MYIFTENSAECAEILMVFLRNTTYDKMFVHVSFY